MYLQSTLLLISPSVVRRLCASYPSLVVIDHKLSRPSSLPVQTNPVSFQERIKGTRKGFPFLKVVMPEATTSPQVGAPSVIRSLYQLERFGAIRFVRRLRGATRRGRLGDQSSDEPRASRDVCEENIEVSTGKEASESSVAPDSSKAHLSLRWLWVRLVDPITSFWWKTGGGLVLGPDWLALLGSNVLLIVPTALYATRTSKSHVCSAVSVTLCAFALCFLSRCAFTDPGIVPRQPPSDATFPMTMLETVNTTLGTTVQMERRWCCVCQCFRPLRAVHCRFCNCCILRRDHHCPWTGQCVGQRNYRYYFGFILSTSAAALFMLIACGRDFFLRRSEVEAAAIAASGVHPSFAVTVWRACVETSFVEPALMLCALVGLFLVGGLVSYHSFLVSHDLTTFEDRKGAFDDHPLRSPFNKGSVVANVLSLLWDDLPPSWLCEGRAAVRQRVGLDLHRPEGTPRDAQSPFAEVVIDRQTGEGRLPSNSFSTDSVDHVELADASAPPQEVGDAPAAVTAS